MATHNKILKRYLRNIALYFAYDWIILSVSGKPSVNAQQLTGIDAIKSVEIDCVNATIVGNLN
jgi:hypothetical protein